MWIWNEVNEFCTKIYFLLLLITLILPEIIHFWFYIFYTKNIVLIVFLKIGCSFSNNEWIPVCRSCLLINLETTHLEYNICWMHVYNIDLLKSSQKCIHICLYHKILTSSKKQQLVTLITFNYQNILLLYRFVLVLYYQNSVDAYQVILPL